MRLRVVLPLLLLAAGLPLAGASAAPVPEGLRVDLVVGEQLPVDPEQPLLAVRWTSYDCTHGCEVRRSSADGTTVLARSTFPAADSPRTFTTYTRTEGAEVALVRLTADGTAERVAARQVGTGYGSEAAFTYAGAWRKDASVRATETMIRRSVSAGDTARLAATDTARQVGIVGARGPASGVMAVRVGGAIARTVELQAETYTAARVVAVVEVPAGKALQVANATPAGRAGREVHVDGFVELTGTPSGASPASALAAGPTGESIDLRVHAPQQVTEGRGYRVEVVARVYGCPDGCAIRNDRGRTLLQRTSPASDRLQTLRVVSDEAVGEVLLLKNERVVAGTQQTYPGLRPDAAFDYSDGWTRTASGDATDDTLMRTTVRGAGATLRVGGLTEGRSVGVIAAQGPDAGVIAIYVDGRALRTVDLRRPTALPRRIVASVDLPLRGRITVINRTPADRAASTVRLDGLAQLVLPDDGD